MSMRDIMSTYIIFSNHFLGDKEEMERRRNEKLKAFWVKWRNLQNLPRKKKKKAKIDLMWEYSILTWDPIEELK